MPRSLLLVALLAAALACGQVRAVPAPLFAGVAGGAAAGDSAMHRAGSRRRGRCAGNPPTLPVAPLLVPQGRSLSQDVGAAPAPAPALSEAPAPAPAE